MISSLPEHGSGLAPNFGIPLTVYATLVDGDVVVRVPHTIL